MDKRQRLVKVTIVTLLGSIYEFPDMHFRVMEPLLTTNNLGGFSQISLINESGSCLVIPFRIIKTVSIDGDVKWVSPVSTVNSP